MFAFIGRSVIQKIITLFFVSIVSFLIIHLAPGEPSQVDPMNPKFTPEVVERFRKEFHLDRPLYVQYVYFYRDLFSGKIISWKDNRSVLAKIWERFLNSLPLFIVGTILTWTFSFPVGIRSAIYRGGFYDRSATFFAYMLISIPGFFFAYILIIFVVTQFQVPVIGMGGIMTAEDALEFFIAGAKAIQVGTANFINPRATTDILDGIEAFLMERGIADLKEIIGTLELNDPA